MAKPSAALIRGVPLFADLDDKTVDALGDEFIERHFDEGAAIATEGVDGLNFFIVESGEATVTVGGNPVGSLGPGDCVRRGRTRRPIGTIGNGDRRVADGGVRASDLELPAVRRRAPRPRLEAARDPRRALCAPPKPGRGRRARPAPHGRGARGRLPRRRRTGAGTSSSSASPDTSRQSPRRRSGSRAMTPKTSSRTSSRRAYTQLGTLRSDDAIRPWLGQLTRNRCLDLLRSSGRIELVADVDEQAADEVIGDPGRGAQCPGEPGSGSHPNAARSWTDSSPGTRATARSATPSTFLRDDREPDLPLSRQAQDRARMTREETSPLARRVDR